jgi:CheY-like chemotaxis protein
VVGQPVKVLIVDDQDIFANALELWLNSRGGFEVVGVARDGSEAVDLAVLLGPDVVLMDLGLPKMDGFEATRRLRALTPDTRVIAITGKAEDEDKQAAFDAGVVDYLVKGGLEEQVQDAIRRALR